MGRPKDNTRWETRMCKMCGIQFDVYKLSLKLYCSKKCANSDPAVKQKIVASQLKTYRKKYGVDHPMQTEATLNNFKQSMYKKYGVEHALQSEKLMNRRKQTTMERYGAENVFQLSKFRDKARQTKLKKYNDPMYHNIERLHDNTYLKFLEWEHITPLFTRTEFTGVTKGIRYKFKCNKCENILIADVNNGYIPSCRKCNCNTTGISYAERELLAYIKSLISDKIIGNDRQILNGKELDIFIPTKNLAIEYNGNYWHTELHGCSKYYHLNKTEQCAEQSIQLIHIFEHEWEEKTSVVKSILKNKLCKSNNKVFARKCNVQEISIKEKTQFLNENHLQGAGRSSVRIGLYYENQLISAMTFGKCRFDTQSEWEIIRFATKIDYTVIGGASKLFKYFVKTYNPKSIITYADKRFGRGLVYEKIGFELVDETPPSYFYVNFSKNIYSRFQFQKHKLQDKLEIFDSNLTEWENMQLNGYDKIWDCGNMKYKLVF